MFCCWMGWILIQTDIRLPQFVDCQRCDGGIWVDPVIFFKQIEDDVLWSLIATTNA